MKKVGYTLQDQIKDVTKDFASEVGGRLAEHGFRHRHNIEMTDNGMRFVFEACIKDDWPEERFAKYAPYPGDQALAGPDMPPMDNVLDVIRYCTSVHDRFGDTAVTISLQWGGSALNARDKYKTRIEELEKEARLNFARLRTDHALEIKRLRERAGIIR